MPSVVYSTKPASMYDTSMSASIPAGTKMAWLVITEATGTASATANINGTDNFGNAIDANNFNYSSNSTRLLRLANPPTGSVTVNWTRATGSSAVILVCTDDTDTADPINGGGADTYTVNDFNVNNTLSRSPASATGELILSFWGCRGASLDLTALDPVSGETAVDTMVGDGGSNILAKVFSVAGGSGVTVDLDPTAANGFASFGAITVSIKAAGGGGSITGSGSAAYAPGAASGSGSELFSGSGATVSYSQFAATGSGSELFSGSGGAAFSSFVVAGLGAFGSSTGNAEVQKAYNAGLLRAIMANGQMNASLLQEAHQTLFKISNNVLTTVAAVQAYFVTLIGQLIDGEQVNADVLTKLGQILNVPAPAEEIPVRSGSGNAPFFAYGMSGTGGHTAPGSNDAFSQENSLPGGPWTTILDAGWGPARTLPQKINYEADDGYGFMDWGSDWYPNSKMRLNGAHSAGATTLNLKGPNDTTIVGSFSPGTSDIVVASTAGWDQSQKLYIAGHPNPYTVSFVDYPSAGYIRLSRGLDFAVTNGTVVSFANFFVPGQQILIFGRTPYPYYEVTTVQTTPTSKSITISPALQENRVDNERLSIDWRGCATVEVDSSYPGADKKVLRCRIPKYFHGGYYPQKVGKHDGIAAAVGRLTWPTGLCTGYLYVAGMIKLTRDDAPLPQLFTHNGNVGTKWTYIKSDAAGNSGIAHILSAFGGWDGGFTFSANYELSPVYTTQAPGNTVAYGPPNGNSANQIPNDEAWHKLEILQTPNTGNNFDGTLKVWIDGVQVVNSAAFRPFMRASGETADLNVLEIDAIYGGGLQECPYDQSMWTGRLLVKVR